MSEEAVDKRNRKSFSEDQENLENMSYWLPKIQASKTSNNSILKIPKTRIVPLDFDMWYWLRSDYYTPLKIAELNDYLLSNIESFLDEEKVLFMKTGIFSNKFSFDSTIIEDATTIGGKLLDIYYTSMMVGADHTSEVVFRQMVEDKENRLKIYSGMPLHTEFRVFYDFDSKYVIGVANYWHPEIMESNLKDDDLLTYQQEKEKIISDYIKHKHEVAKEVKIFMDGTTDLKGKWSIDVMKNDEDFWLIDMARMERSALISEMELIEL